MRKILSFMALALAFVACQNEPAVETIGNGDLVEVTLSVDAPEMEITRGLDNDTLTGRNSALGAIDFFNDADWAKYDVRYILEVYDATDADGANGAIYLERMVNCLDKYAPTNFTLRLVPDREYKFVVFADFVADGNYTKTEPADKLAIADWYYDTADLRDIKIKPEAAEFNAMNEARDAYFVSKNLTVTATSLSQSLTLTRPFAKLRVIATDLDYIAGYSAPGYVEVEYNTMPIVSSFNAVNGIISTEELTGDAIKYAYSVDKNEPYNEGYDSVTTNQTLFADYVLAKEGEQTTVCFTMSVYEDDGNGGKGRLIKTTEFNTQIPVQRNHLTTIIGDILTNEANIEIKINDNFDDEWVFGAGDGNGVGINVWNAGIVNTTTGDYTFDVEAEGNTFQITVDKTAVSSDTLATGTYQFTDKEVAEGLFNAINLKADDTRAMVDVEVIGGLMTVEKLGDTYGIVLDLVLDYGNNDVRHAAYTYQGPILFGETLDAPKATATAEGNAITVAWEAVDKATAYYVRLVAEGNEFEETTELSKVYENLAWATEYSFEVYAKNDTLSSVIYTVTATTEEEPEIVATPLATPLVLASVAGNVITLTWETIENAAKYSVEVGENGAVETENTTYEFTGKYDTKYTITVIALPADDEVLFTASEAAVVYATTEAEAVEPTTKKVTVAEFLAAAEDDTIYELTGVITSVANTTYGNFYLKDATGEVYIYGLCSPEGAQKYWAESGAKIGDTITIQTIRTSHNGAPQGKDAIFVELVPFVETASEWGIVGDITGWGETVTDLDIVMYNTWKADNLFVAYNVEFTSGAFKIRANNEWNDAKNYGLATAGKIYADKYYTLTNGSGSKDATPMAYGTYDVYFDLANERVALVTPGKEYADAVDGGDPVVVIEGLTDHAWGLVGSFNNWDVANCVAATVEGDWAVVKNVTLANGAEFKFAADNDWTLSYGSGCDVNVGETYTTYSSGGNMKFIGEDGAYNFYFSLVDAKFYMEPYSSATTVTFNVADYGFANQEALLSYTIDEVITIAFDGGGNNNSPKYYTGGTAARCYPKNTITVSGKTIKKVEVIAPSDYTNAIDLYDGNTKLENFTWEGSSENVVLTFDPKKTSGQSRFVSINVTYE